MDRFEINDIRPLDADELARLHQRCFEGYFLTNLGRPFLRRFYREYCRHPFDHGVTARVRDSNELVAFVVGTSDTQAHFRSFYRRNVPVLLPWVCWRVLTNPVVRGAIWTRTAHMRSALMSMIPGYRRPASETISDKGPRQQCPVRLLGIAVAPEFRGSGVATLAQGAFEDRLRAAGHKRVGLSVLPDNARAIAFYEKTAWRVTHSSRVGVWFERDL